MKNVILADDDQILHEGLNMLLERNGFNVVASACSFIELKEIIQTVESDFIVCDCKMPGEGPANFLEHSKRYFPDRKVLFLTGLKSGFLFQHLIDAKVDGLVSKKDSIHCLVEALKEIREGKHYLSKSVKDALEGSIGLLTAKELQIFELIVNGKSNSEMADLLCNSPSTIGRHRENLMRKLDAHSVVDLMRFAQERGFFDA